MITGIRYGEIEEFPGVRLMLGGHYAVLITDRETDVLAGLGRGLSNAELSAELQISEGTTKTHVSRVLAKLGLRSRTQAAIAAQESGLL